MNAEEKAKNKAKVKSFPCSKCNKGFSTKYSMQRHERDCGVEPIRVECEKCGRSLKNNDMLEKHQLTCFCLTKKLVCRYCDELFCSTFSLRRHFHRFHKDESPPIITTDLLEPLKKVEKLEKYQLALQNRKNKEKHKKILNFTLPSHAIEDEINFRYQMNVFHDYDYMEDKVDPLGFQKAVIYPLKRFKKQINRY